ncbi:MAG: YHS domain-containing (seleno)protein [Ferruginibacter sp.]
MKLLFVFAAIFTMISFTAPAQDASLLRKKHNNLSDGLAIKGYDPVAYFTQHKAVKGSKENAVYHQGVTYYFSSVENKELFKANPFKYEPEYGGWCAYAMGKNGEKVSVDPATFKIINGKLYLFYNKYFTNTLTDWNKDETNLKQKADANWPKLLH